MISYYDFIRLLTDAAGYDNLDAYIAEYGSRVRTSRLLETIWTLGHDGLTINSIKQAVGSNMTTLSREYGVPYRTLQNWKLGERAPSEWQLKLFAYAVLSDSAMNKE